MTAQYGQTEARAMLEMINEFRTTTGVWCWDKNGNKDTESYANLSELSYDYELEKVAMLRAMEIALHYSHTRPNSEYCFTAYTGTYKGTGENIAAGYRTAEAVYKGWREDDEPYSNQGHRRNMLNSGFTAVGIGHVYCNGCHYWVQEFRYPTSSMAATKANDAETTVAIELDTANIKSQSIALSDGSDSVEITYGTEIAFPDIVLNILTGSTWPGNTPVSVSADLAWQVEDATIASLSDGKIKGLKIGSTKLTAVFGSQTLSIPVTVNPVPISSASASEIADFVYSGKENCPNPSLTVNGLVLSQGVDYDLAYANNVNAGKAILTATGKGNYTGTFTKEFTISPKSINEVMIEVGEMPTYTGTAAVLPMTFSYSGTTLAEGIDYTCTYINNVNAGQDTALVTISGKGNYGGDLVKSFTIKQADLSKGILLGLYNAEYTGKQIKEAPTVMIGTFTMHPETDYTAVYSGDLVNIGTVQVTVTGRGNCFGTLTGSYQIIGPEVTLAKRPTSIKAKAKKNQVTVSWKKIKNNKKGRKLLKKIRSIQLQYSTDPNFLQDVTVRRIGKKKNKVILKLQRKTTYYIRVRYVDSEGVSDWSKVKRVRTK